MIACCKHGHPWTPENTLWAKRSDDPAKKFRACRTCHRASCRKSLNLKYRRFDAWREKVKAANLARYHRRKGENCETQIHGR